MRSGAQYSSPGAIALLLVVVALVACLPKGAQAQDTSFAPSISDQLSNSTDSDGFDSSFDTQTSNLTNAYLRTDISDPTNSTLMGSLISPVVANVYTAGSEFLAPETQVLTDAQQAVRSSDPYFGGRQSRAFSIGQAQTFRTGLSTTQSGAGAFSIGSEQTAFANNSGGRAAFTDQSASQSSATSFSGQGSATDDGLGLSLPNPQASLAAVGQFNGSGVQSGGDPALSVSGNVTNNSSSSEDKEVSPSSQIASFFAETQTPPVATQYDDGQTPLLHASIPPGQLQPTLTAYTSAGSGFPDSTRGLADLPSQAALSASPFEKSAQGESVSPFPAISDGEYYSRSSYLSPNLHAQPVLKQKLSLSDEKRRLKVSEHKRITMGMPYSNAEELYRKELTDYMRYGAKGRSSLPDLSGRSDQSSPTQTSMQQASPR